MPLFQTQGSVMRTAAVSSVALITLAATAFFTLRGGSDSTTYVDKQTAIVTCTGTGGLAKYSYCNWKEPSDNAGSGSVITGIYYIGGKTPVTFGLDGTVGYGATTSGSVALSNFTNVQISTGTLLKFSSGMTLISEGDYLRLVTLGNPTSSHRASIVIEFISRLSR